MAINPALLIAAPMLQNYFVNNADGTPLSAGIVTCYQDNSRTTLKNWYYQSGTPGNYTYIPLANPLTLSAVGTIVDVNGNDTIPFFYPYEEDDQTTVQPYYITVVNSNGQQQFFRQNFPYLSEQSASTQVPTYNNLIANNVFYHNLGSLNATMVTNAILAPSQHDGFSASSYTDLRFIKSTTGAIDTISFTPFGLNNDPFLPEPTPEYYLNLNCSEAQSGETSKLFQLPISLHLKTLENITGSITLWAQNNSGNVNNIITLSILQFLGSGAISTSPITQIASITLNNSWTKYIINFTFPSSQGLTLGTGGDDALFLNINMPVAVTCNISFTKPSIYLSDTVPTNEFQTYDQIDTIINSPRTGDVRVSLNNFAPFGWVLMNDGTIGNASSNATRRANIDTWNLFYLLWNSVGATYAPMFNSSGSPVSYGVSAIADWNANNQISLIKQLGSAIASAGLANSGGSTTWALGQNFGEQNHTLSITEMPAHSHPPGSGATNFACSTLGGNSNFNSGTQYAAFSTTGNTGGGGAHNNTQPTTFYNIFMKL